MQGFYWHREFAISFAIYADTGHIWTLMYFFQLKALNNLPFCLHLDQLMSDLLTRTGIHLKIHTVFSWK